ncbi:MAG: hypothetical protein ABII01_04440 [Candidatus Woesearchaeota archaeon]
MDKKELEVFKYNIDLWIKDINSKITDITDYPQILQDNIDNIEHNYELINELKSDINGFKKDIQKLKMTQLLIIKKLFREDFENASKNKEFMAKIMSTKNEGSKA